METGILAFFFSPRGRVNRAWFWAGTLMLGVIGWGTIFLLLGVAPEVLIFAVPLLLVVFGWSSLAITVKRWHDRDKSAWWLLVGLIPLWTLIECGFLRGKPPDGLNQYGDPFDEPL